MHRTPTADSQADRRGFVKQGLSCSAYIAGLVALSPAMTKRVFAAVQQREKLFEEQWGWIEKLAAGAWAHVATPFEQKDYTTVSNGGIIAGRDRVLAVESFQTAKGAAWLARRCKELTGRWPTDVVLTHFHGDHVSGSLGYQTDEHSPRMWGTKTTFDLIKKQQAEGQQVNLLDNLCLIDESKPTQIDLGNRTVKLSPGGGHTPSDVAIEIIDPNIVFCGDLVWNRLVPNFRDASPKSLTASVASLVRDKDSIYVPGHGPLATLDDLKLYQEFLDMMENTVRAAHQAGQDSGQAAREFQLPGKFAEWYIFADSVKPAIFSAWYREIENEK